MLSTRKEKIKSIILWLLLAVSIIFLLYYLVWVKYLKEPVMYKLYGQQENNMETNIFINGAKLPFDKKTNTYYYPVNIDDKGKSLELNIRVETSKKSTNTIYGIEFNEHTTIETEIDFDKKIEVYSNSTYYYNKCYIAFTNLPTIAIDKSDVEVGEDYVYGNLNILDPNYEDNDTSYEIKSQMKMRVRGSSSRLYSKKSYRLELYNNSSKNNISLLGLRDDSDWVLDSLHIDSSKIRNLLSYEVWNLMNEDVEDEYKVNMQGKFVEVFMNDEYAGLYVLKEPIDDKSLNLRETSSINSGILIKGIDHDISNFIDEEISTNKSDIYHDFEMKYPKNLKDNTVYWHTILSKMKDYYTENITDEVIDNTFYSENFINYRLFITAISAGDNYEPKNVYLSLKDMNDDTKIMLTPWDLDLTFGLEWAEGFLPYENLNIIYEIDTGSAEKYKENLKLRWNFLRKNVYNDEVINSIIDEYYKELTAGGAIKRESEKWGGEDFDSEIANIKSWCSKRWPIIDDYIDGM